MQHKHAQDERPRIAMLIRPHRRAGQTNLFLAHEFVRAQAKLFQQVGALGGVQFDRLDGVSHQTERRTNDEFLQVLTHVALLARLAAPPGRQRGQAKFLIQ